MNNIQGSLPQDNTDEIVCPYLGMRDDVTTSLGFPSAYNYCHRVHPAEPANREHQGSFCLTAAHKQCPVFVHQEGISMPAQLRAHDSEARSPNRYFGIAILVILFVALAGGVFIGLNPGVLAKLKAKIPGGATQTASLAAQPQTAISTYTPSLPQTVIAATATPTISNTPSPTSTPRPVLGLEVNLGVGGQFLIHTVVEGESLSILAKKYGTTMEAIQAAIYSPYSPPPPIQPGENIVIPIGLTDLQDFPSFDTYMVIGENIQLDVLASRLSVDVNSLSHYNNLPPDYVLFPGDMLLIPHTRNTPTP